MQGRTAIAWLEALAGLDLFRGEALLIVFVLSISQAVRGRNQQKKSTTTARKKEPYSVKRNSDPETWRFSKAKAKKKKHRVGTPASWSRIFGAEAKV